MRRLFVLSIFFLALNQMLHGQSPRIDSVDPSQGPIAGGTAVTIKGANFQNAKLWMDKVEIVPQAVAAAEIRFVTPRHDNGIATIKVATSAGAAYGEFLFIPPRLEDLPPGYITTVAGIGTFVGFYRPATQAEIFGGSNLAYDRNGHLYISSAERVNRVRADGLFEPYAGTGVARANFTEIGDGGPASEALLGFSRGVATDSDNNVYIADQTRIRRVDARTGIISTIAGDGIVGYSGDGGPAAQARFMDASKLVIDSQGNIIFIDFDDISFTPRIRKITKDGIISTVAGISPPGFSGDGGPATQAQFDFGRGGSDFGGVAVDSQGNLYIADTGNNRIRRIDGRTGIVTTIAGPALHAGGTDYLFNLNAITVDNADNVYFFPGGNGEIVKLSPSGEILALYGNGKGLSEDGTPIGKILLGKMINGMTMDPLGNLVFSDWTFRQIRRLNFASGVIETVAGVGPHPFGENGPAIATTLGSYNGDIAFLPTGELLIGDSGHFLLRKMDRNGNISTVAGTGAALGEEGNEVSASRAVIAPVSVKTDAAGRIFLADSAAVFRIDKNGTMYRVAGRLYEAGFSGDGGPALNADICQPWDVTVDATGNLFIADSNNNRIRRIDAKTGIITTVAGSGPVNGFEHYFQGTYCGDGGPATKACLNTPLGVAVDSEGNLFIGDAGRIRKVDTNGIITTFAPSGANKLILDSVGNLYTSAIERYDHLGNRTPLAGQAVFGFSGDGGPATQALLRNYGLAIGIAISQEGDIFFLDGFNYRIRAIRYGAVLAPPNAQIQITRGTPQSTLTATAFDAPLEVLVLDSSGKPATGVRVDFVAPSGGPSCTFTNNTAFISVITGRTGHASAVCTANTQLGTYNITATPLTAAASATFALTNKTPQASILLALTVGSTATASTIGGNGSTQVGYASVGIQSGAVPYGTAVFSFKQNGVTVTEAGVPASPPTTAARIFIDYRSSAAAIPARISAGTVDINTGIAAVNSGFASANITYTLRNIAGITLATGHGTLAAGAHFAKFIDRMNEVAPDFVLPANFQTATQFATMEIFSDQPLSILALRMTANQRNEALFTTTPTADLTKPLANNPIFFPQFADGGGYTTSIILFNTSNGIETGKIEIRDDNGNPFVVSQAGGASGSTFTYSIPAGGAVRFQTDGLPTTTKAGWVQLTPDAGTSTPVGAGVFSYNPEDVLVTESGIPAAVSTTHARIYVDLSGGHNTGLAIANPSNTNANIITMKAFQSDGFTEIGTSQGPLQLSASGHSAQFVDKFIAGLPAEFTGVLDIASTSPFAALTVRSLYNERHDFLMTTFPIADANRAAPSPIIFPQIVDGGGYKTQFIFLSPAGASNMAISFFTEAGVPLVIGK